MEQNVVSLIFNLFRYLFHNSDIMQDRFQRNNGIPLLSFLLQRLPKRFVDINLLRMCQEYVAEAQSLNDKTLLNLIYEHFIFDFRIWNKADYEIRIGHIQYISTIIKDDKKYFRKKYGIQFFLDVIKTYFGKSNNELSINNQASNVSDNTLHMQSTMNDEDLRNLRNSFFGLIKYYAQKEIKINELNSIISFLAITRNVLFQNDLLDMLINLLEAPNSSDQLYLLLFEPNIADGLYALIVQTDISEAIQKKLLKLIKILLKSKKVYDKSKSRLRLEECGTYAGLISKLNSEYSSRHYQKCKFSENLVIDLLENFLIDEATLTSYDNLWHILSLLTLTGTPLIGDMDELIRIRLKVCELIIGFLFTNANAARLLTKSPAWQDILCQLLCIEKKSTNSSSSRSDVGPRKSSGLLPNIVVSSSSSSNFNNNNGQAAAKEMVVSPIRENEKIEFQAESGDEQETNEEHDDWENLDMKEMQPSNEQEQVSLIIKKAKFLTKLASEDNVDDKDLVTSTPHNNKIVNKISKSDGQSDFNKNLADKTNLNSDKVTSTLIKTEPQSKQTNKSGKSRKNLEKKINDDELVNEVFVENKETVRLAESVGSGIGCRVELGDDNDGEVFNKYQRIDEKECPEHLNSTEATELCEKILYLIFKLLWEGVVGSNEEAWKVFILDFIIFFNV